jgi:hypothetical protein
MVFNRNNRNNENNEQQKMTKTLRVMQVMNLSSAMTVIVLDGFGPVISSILLFLT